MYGWVRRIRPHLLDATFQVFPAGDRRRLRLITLTLRGDGSPSNGELCSAVGGRPQGAAWLTDQFGLTWKADLCNHWVREHRADEYPPRRRDRAGPDAYINTW